MFKYRGQTVAFTINSFFVVEWLKICKIYAFNVCQWLEYGTRLLVEQQLCTMYTVHTPLYLSTKIWFYHRKMLSKYVLNSLWMWLYIENLGIFKRFRLWIFMCIMFLDLPKVSGLSDEIQKIPKKHYSKIRINNQFPKE